MIVYVCCANSEKTWSSNFLSHLRQCLLSRKSFDHFTRDLDLCRRQNQKHALLGLKRKKIFESKQKIVKCNKT